MNSWTPEAREYLEGYLLQVRAFALRDGEDAEDIASALREHVECEAAGAGDTLVSLDILRRILATVGSPEEVGSQQALLVARKANEARAPASPAAGAASHQPEPVARSRGVSCLALVIIALVAILLLVLTVVALVAGSRTEYPAQTTESRQQAARTQALEALEAIDRAEQAALTLPGADIDGDDVPDYADRHRLQEIGTCASRLKGDYVLNLETTPSGANGGKPTYRCEAVPVNSGSMEHFFIDQTGKIQVSPGVDPAVSSMAPEVGAATAGPR